MKLTIWCLLISFFLRTKHIDVQGTVFYYCKYLSMIKSFFMIILSQC